jgi:hypothetical protein
LQMLWIPQSSSCGVRLLSDVYICRSHNANAINIHGGITSDSMMLIRSSDLTFPTSHSLQDKLVTCSTIPILSKSSDLEGSWRTTYLPEDARNKSRIANCTKC